MDNPNRSHSNFHLAVNVKAFIYSSVNYARSEGHDSRLELTRVLDEKVWKVLSVYISLY